MDAHELLARLERATTEYRAAQAAAQEHGAAVLKTARQQLRLTQRQMADKLGVSHTYLSKVENGHTRVGKPTLAAVAAALAERSGDRSVHTDTPDDDLTHSETVGK